MPYRPKIFSLVPKFSLYYALELIRLVALICIIVLMIQVKDGQNKVRDAQGQGKGRGERLIRIVCTDHPDIPDTTTRRGWEFDG